MPKEISVVELLAGVSAVALTVFGFLLREHWRRTQQHDERLRALERSVATREDIAGVYERLHQLGDQMNQQHQTILERLVDLGRRGR